MTTPSEKKKKSKHAVRYGTAEGELKFGHLHRDNKLSGAMMRNGEASAKGIHYISLESTGSKERKGSTICSSPGTFNVKAGYNMGQGKAKSENKNTGIYMDAVNGDIVIRAPHGRIRLEAIDVDITASGANNAKGTVNISANEKVIIKAQTIDISSKVNTKIFSEKTVDIIGNSLLNIYGGLVDVADGATKLKGSKGGTYTNEINNAGGFEL